MSAPTGTRWAAAAVVTAAGLALLAAACGGSKPGQAAQLGSSAEGDARASALAFSRCMRSHGVPGFPDPDSQGNFPRLSQRDLGVPKQTSKAADDVCRNLLSRGHGTATPQQRQQKLEFALKVAACLRRHGYPDFPDPGASSGSQELPPGIDPSSPRFEAAETSCEQQARKALGLP